MLLYFKAVTFDSNYGSRLLGFRSWRATVKTAVQQREARLICWGPFLSRLQSWLPNKIYVIKPHKDYQHKILLQVVKMVAQQNGKYMKKETQQGLEVWEAHKEARQMRERRKYGMVLDMT
jgi:hypothetical protein